MSALLFCNFLVKPIQKHLDFFPESDTYAECYYSEKTYYNGSGVVFFHKHASHNQTPYHARQSPQCRNNKERLKFDFGNACGVADHILWNSGYKIQEKDYGVHLFGVKTFYIIGHLFLTEKYMEKISA